MLHLDTSITKLTWECAMPSLFNKKTNLMSFTIHPNVFGFAACCIMKPNTNEVFIGLLILTFVITFVHLHLQV